MVDLLQRTIEEYDTNRFVTRSWVVRHNDEITFERLVSQLRRRAREHNTALSAEDVRDFENGNWVVLYLFDHDAVLIKAGRDELHLQKQPVWLEGPIDILPGETALWYKEQIMAAAQDRP